MSRFRGRCDHRVRKARERESEREGGKNNEIEFQECCSSRMVANTADGFNISYIGDESTALV